VNAGGRLDDYSTFGSHETWRAGGRLALSSSLVARGNIGTGFRAPSLADLFYPGFSNPDLEPEESLGWDLGLEAGLAADRIKVRAAWFSNRFTNLIAYSTVAFRPENIAEARTEGLESSLDWEVGSGWNVRASYTWLPTAEDQTRATRLLRRAEHAGSLNLYGPIVAGLALDARVLAVGASADSDFSAYPVAEVTNAGYLKTDLGVAVQLGSWATATLRVGNLFGKSYEETFGYPALGRIFRVGMTVGF
jgi:vitamin B12 transporter